MTIIRISHNKENPFITVSKKILEIETLSWEAKGLWTYLMGRPDNWNLRVDHLTKHFSAGRDKTLRILNELIDHGLCFWYQERTECGSLSEGIYIVFESPHSEEFAKLKEKYPKKKKEKKSSKKPDRKEILPCPENPDTANPDTANQVATPYINKDNEINKTPKSPKRGLIFLQRKEWAKRNESKSPCGYSLAFEDKFVVVSGSIQEDHYYHRNDPYWEKIGL